MLNQPTIAKVPKINDRISDEQLHAGFWHAQEEEICAFFTGKAKSTADWTLQQFREAIPSDHSYRFLIHDRHATFSRELDQAVENFGITPIRTPVRAPQANAYCERLIGTVRRECLDYVIPINERHLRKILREWVAHYNRGRQHASLGPGIPDSRNSPPPRKNRHRLEPWEKVTSTSVLGGLIMNIKSSTRLRDLGRNFCAPQRRRNCAESTIRP